MPKRIKGRSGGKASKAARRKRKIRKKQRDKVLISAIIVSLFVIVFIVAANLIGIGVPMPALPTNIAQPVVSVQNTEKQEAYTDEDKLIRFDFIDVGQGDSTLITTPGGEYILIDAGTVSGDKLMKYLEVSGVDEIEYLILTHPHNDHIGSAKEVLEEYDVKCVIMSEVVTATALFNKLYEALVEEKEQGCKVYSATPGDVYETDGCTLNILGPLECDDEDLNNSSVILTVSYGEYDAIFTGDSEKKIEEKLVLSGADIDCELYHVAHHGSDTSSTADFINAVSPYVSVISCGKDNSYGHPSANVVERLTSAGSDVYVTADIGTITVLSDGDGYSVLSER